MIKLSSWDSSAAWQRNTFSSRCTSHPPGCIPINSWSALLAALIRRDVWVAGAASPLPNKAGRWSCLGRPHRPHKACASSVEPWPLACSLFYWRWHPHTASSHQVPVTTCSSASTPAVCLSVCSATSAHFAGGGGGNACLLFPGYREMPKTRRLTLDLTAHTSQVPETQKEAFQLTGHRETLSNSAESRPALTLTLCVISRVNYMWSCSWHFEVL